jgi:hypothetical protein
MSLYAAQRLREAVASGDEATVARILARPDLPRIAVEVARIGAAVEGRKRHPERWKPDHELKPHGTHAAFNRHKKRGETPCLECVEGERAHMRLRQRRVRSEQRALVVDEVAVKRVLNGEDYRLNDAEKRVAALAMWRRGDTTTAIAERLHVGPRKVRLWLSIDAAAPGSSVESA